MTILDGGIFKGWVRERRFLKKLLEEYLIKHSPLVRKYAESIAKITGLDVETVLRSEPVRNYVKKIIGD